MSWKYEDFATSFFAFLGELRFADMLDENSLQRLRETENAIEEKQGKIASIAKGLERLTQAIMDSPNPSKTIAAKIASMEVEQTRLEAELGTLKNNLEQQQSIQRNSKNLQAENKSLIARRNDPEVREVLRRKLRDQVEKIELFGEGFPQESSGFENLAFVLGAYMNAHAEFTDTPQTLHTSMKELKEWQKTVVLPRGKQERYFKVYFKTGATKFVKPNFDDPSVYKMLMVSENKV